MNGAGPGSVSGRCRGSGRRRCPGGLARTGPGSAADLGRGIGLDRTTVTRRADRLERTGLLERRPDPADGRATLLALTDDGHDIVAVTRRRLAADIETSLAGWPPAEARTFARLLRRFLDEGPFAPDRDRPRHPPPDSLSAGIDRCDGVP
ncbi:MarR family winged helix-turn-helix transcriptional regulator [Kitasatospora purpeofusca]|uniref:MarR family winged helix-turn-helix transcriptional regulator n=1 Tax=Kitasatospora purpeofusca TaxID=67352 RepID=A0ABZ1TX37_9ACTN|nr:MarR family winged helix-turn-helix transcriptional regulator [Kitasatospora purpeofusca]